MRKRNTPLFKNVEKVVAAGILSLSAIAVAQPVGYDFNGDGETDFPVSAISYDDTNPDIGAARIWSGVSKSIIHTIAGTDTNTLFGWSTGSAGDLDGDGKDDLIVGEPLWSATSNYEGRIQVFSGDDASVLLTIAGPYVENGLGRYVTGIGDWNGDGTPDIASSAWNIVDTDADGIGDDAIGMVFVFSGVDGATLAEFTEPTATPSFGYSIFGLGDINGDSKADIAIVDREAEFISGSGIQGQISIFTGSATTGTYDILDALEVITNLDPNIRVFGSQIDVMHPDLWLDKATIQVMSLVQPYTGGPNEADVKIDILKIDGVQTGDKGLRPSLKLSGDVNIDGKVNALDIQDSISLLGVDPQAVGVMPIADSNNDNIIDSTDIQVVIDGYGTTTDVYVGLWDGTRLLSVAGSSAGFGDTAGLSVVPVGPLPPTKFFIGIQPGGDCPQLFTTPPTGGSMLFGLLHADEGASCNDCPSYANQASCYECTLDKGVSGGNVSVITVPTDPNDDPSVFPNNNQPLDSETVTFKIEGVTETPGELTCKDSCGEDGATVPTPLGTPSYVWQVYTKGPNGWPTELDPNPDQDGHDGWPTGDTLSGIGGSACEEKKAVCWAKPSGPCIPDNPVWTRVGENEVKFANFRIVSATIASPPGLSRNRTKLGIGEQIIVMVEPFGTAVAWEIDGVPQSGTRPGWNNIFAPWDAESWSFTASKDGCERNITFEILSPTRMNYTKCPASRFHNANQKHVGFKMKLDLDSDSVSFYRVQVRERGGPQSNSTGIFETVSVPHDANGPSLPGIHGEWLTVEEDNQVIGTDTAAFEARTPGDTNVGTFEYLIPIEYRLGDTGPTRIMDEKETQSIDMGVNCVTVSKGNGSATGCDTDPNGVPESNCP